MEQETEQANRTRALVDAFVAVRGGDLSQTWLARFSDLSRDGVGTFENEWPALPETVRIDVVRRLDELSEERVELNFGRALRVALDDPSPVVRQLAIAGLWEDDSADLLERLRVMLREDDARRTSALRRLRRWAASPRLPRSSRSRARPPMRCAMIWCAQPQRSVLLRRAAARSGVARSLCGRSGNCSDYSACLRLRRSRTAMQRGACDGDQPRSAVAAADPH